MSAENNKNNGNKPNNVYFYNDYLEKKILVIEKNNKLKENITFENFVIIEINNSKIKNYIVESDVIIIVGNIDISQYNLSNKFVININNERNFGQHTLMVHLGEEKLYIDMIKSIYYAIFLPGCITISLYEIAASLNGRMTYNKFNGKDINKLYKVFDLKTKSKMFIVFEVPIDYSLNELNNILVSIKERYANTEIEFGMPVLEDINELNINVFCEL